MLSSINEVEQYNTAVAFAAFFFFTLGVNFRVIFGVQNTNFGGIFWTHFEAFFDTFWAIFKGNIISIPRLLPPFVYKYEQNVPFWA